MKDGAGPPAGGWREWRGFGILLLGGLGLAFLFEMFQLVQVLGKEAGVQRGAIWAMLFMILALLVVVVVIGGGLVRALVRQRQEEEERKGFAPLRILFVCIENSCRSQMAEAFARRLGGKRVEAESAGSRPSGQVNPRAAAFMREVGYDLGKHRSTSVEEIEAEEFDAVVSMGCGDACPFVPARHRLEWDIPDPKELPDEEFRQVRDLIEAQVRDLIAGLTVGAPGDAEV